MRNDQGFSLIELLIVVAIIGIIAAIAIPNLLKSRQAANESAAIGSLRTINSAQATYQSTAGGGKNFAGTLFVLHGTGHVDSTLGTLSGSSGMIIKHGYWFILNGANSTTTLPSYFDSRAVPTSTGSFGIGNRAFSSNESSVIYQIAGAGAVNGAAPPGSRAPAGMTPIE